METPEWNMPEDLKSCVAFHGHLCPGLMYGYRVAKEAMRLMGLKRSADEEVVAISENDSCAVDGLQMLLGTTAGKGNLSIMDWGKNAYTVYCRSRKQGFRFSRKKGYRYSGPNADEFKRLESFFVAGEATEAQRGRQKWLKALDLFEKPFDEIFITEMADIPEPAHAPLAPSVACSRCGEMTMATRMVEDGKGGTHCVPCSGT